MLLESSKKRRVVYVKDKKPAVHSENLFGYYKDPLTQVAKEFHIQLIIYNPDLLDLDKPKALSKSNFFKILEFGEWGNYIYKIYI